MIRSLPRLAVFAAAAAALADVPPRVPQTVDAGAPTVARAGDAGKAALKAALTLTPPAATLEAFGDGDDFPWVTPVQGAKLVNTQHSEDPLDITPVAGTKTPAFVGANTVNKVYDGPAGLAAADLAASYRAAFEKAGWTVPKLDGPKQPVFAHFAQNGRNVWAKVWRESDGRWNVTVADVGSSLRTKLEKVCKAELYGVRFEPGTATLRPESAEVLEQVLAVFDADPRLRGQVGGHSDDSGNAAADKRLSQQRADAVRAWLTQHGLKKNRLVTRGFGSTQPLVQNDSPAHRARNTRIELKTSACR